MTRARQPLSRWAFVIRAKPPPAIIRPARNALPAGMKCLMRICLTSRLLCLWDSMRKLIILALAVKPRFARPSKPGKSFCRKVICRCRIPLRATGHGLLRNPWFEEEFVTQAQSIIRTMNL